MSLDKFLCHLFLFSPRLESLAIKSISYGSDLNVKSEE